MYKQIRRNLAVMISPLVPVVLVILESGFHNNWIGYLIIICSVFFSYTCFFLVGLPIVKYLRLAKRYNLLTIAVSGGVSGFIGFYLILKVIALTFQTHTDFDLKTGLYGLMLGASTAIFYWGVEKATGSNRIL